MNDHAGPQWAMADISEKKTTRRVAVAGGSIRVGEEAFGRIASGTMPKGDPLAMAEIAGIQAAKQTPALIPLCHPISLNRVIVRSFMRPDTHSVNLYCAAEIAAKTGVEMEALTGLSVALLTVWDLTKPINPALEISRQRLFYKSGGKSGTWTHPDGVPEEVRTVLEELGLVA